MGHRSRRLGIFAALAGAVLGCGGTGPTATPSPVPPEPVTTSVREDGVVVSLTLERPAVETGETMLVRGVVRNVGARRIAWVNTHCEWMDAFYLDGPKPPVQPSGRGWPGTAGWMKEVLIPRGQFFGAVIGAVIPVRMLLEDSSLSCSMGHDVEWLEPNTALTAEMAYRALVAHRLPAPPGTYRVTFWFWSLGPTPPEVPDMRDYHETAVSVTGDFEVTGEPFSGVPAAIALDEALGDPRVAAWLAPLERGQFDRAERFGIELLDGRWVLLAATYREELRVEMRPSDGAVLSVTITPRD